MPPKLQLWRLEPFGILECQFNPRKLPEKLKAEYTRLTVPGMSHQPMQYGHTSNFQVTIETLFAVQTKDDVEKLQEARRFIMSLMYPWKGHASPPRAMLVLAPTFSLTGFVIDLDGGHEFFDSEMNTTWWTCKLTFEEVRDSRLYGDDVLLHGTQRGTGARFP